MPYLRTITALLLLVLAGALGVQSYRLQGRTGERDVLALEKSERVKRDALRALNESKNRERTDEEYRAARARAGRVVVRVQNAAGGIRYTYAPVASSRDDSTVCFDRGRLDAEITALVERHASGLTAIARAGEEVAAAYRACRAYVRD